MATRRRPAHPGTGTAELEFAERPSHWQWWPIGRRGRTMILDDTPRGFRPVVQVIDNFERNHKLALAFEARVDKGRLFVCSGALLERPDRPESRQLLHSLLRYVGSEQFLPRDTLDPTTLEKILRPR